MHQWSVYSEFDEASKAAADFLAANIKTCLEQKEYCHVVLPGGNTPAVCLGHLAKKALPWDRVHWYPGDERCYPQGHAERNDVMLEAHLWSHIADTNTHIIPAELGAEEAAAAYRGMISALEYFDIALLGMGEDGHTASLFPDNKALLDARSVIPVYDAPKPPSERVSLSLDILKKTPCKIVLASGAAKAPIIARIKAGEPLPINCLGDINWYVDQEAVP